MRLFAVVSVLLVAGCATVPLPLASVTATDDAKQRQAAEAFYRAETPQQLRDALAQTAAAGANTALFHEVAAKLAQLEGRDADLTNASAKRKAGTIYAGSFLEEFVEGRPWAHLDIAGTAWDVGREYVGKGPTGTGVRLIVSLAQSLSG